MKKLFLIIFLFALSVSVQAQESPVDDRLTQEAFAVELVKIMDLEDRLPVSSLPRDSVNLLDGLGISPLDGWMPKEFLNQEDYLVLIGKAQGKEGLVHKRAIQVERKNMDLINEKWKSAYEATKVWPSLEQLLNDKEYFPNGAPQSPYGIKYADRNRDHKVDPYFSPLADLSKIREFLTF